MRLRLAEIDIGADGVEGDATVHGALPARHLSAAEAAGHHRLAALSATSHGAGNGLLEGAPEGDSPLQLVGDVAGDQLGVQLRHADLLDVHPDALAGEGLQLIAQLIDLLAPTADDDAGLRCVNGYCHLVGVPLDLHPGDAGVLEVLGNVAAHAQVFLKEITIALLGEPLALPIVDDAEAESGWMYLLAHVSSPVLPRRW